VTPRRSPGRRTRWVALLRGINVGGNNIIPMADLRECVRALGYTDVVTYIQSGNVLFDAPGTARQVATTLEKALSASFAYQAKLVLRSAAEMQDVLDDAPEGFGSDRTQFKYDVLFARPGVDVERLLAEVPVHPEVDVATAGRHALYFRRLIARETSSRLNRLVQMPVYKELTIRNWNTTLRLAQMAGTPSATDT
jgi:uncharacterized protein (DUF1697 family)